MHADCWEYVIVVTLRVQLAVPDFNQVDAQLQPSPSGRPIAMAMFELLAGQRSPRAALIVLTG